MTKTTIYYSVKNCGDGSAYPEFFYDEDVAQDHQDSQSEGWGESCVDSLVIEHEGELKVQDCQTREDYISSLQKELARAQKSIYRNSKLENELIERIERVRL